MKTKLKAKSGLTQEEYAAYPFQTIRAQIIKFMNTNEYCRCGCKNIFTIKTICWKNKAGNIMDGKCTLPLNNN